MDIIYTDGQLNDIGILDCVKLDYDTAGDMDYVLEMATEDASLEENSMWYVIGEEYLGIVEAVKCDSASDTVTYSGTNTRGILKKRSLSNNHIKVVAGNFQEIATEWLEQSGLSGLFMVEETELEIGLYMMPAFATVYDAIMGILETENALPMFTVGSDRKVHIEAGLRRDMSDEIQYTGNNAYSFAIEKQYNAINHLLLHSQEEDGTVYAIHLFTDQNGGVQDYATKDIPLEDSDYILDTSMQVISGNNERTLAVETDLELVENFKLMQAAPGDWKQTYDNYYQQVEKSDGQIDYDPVEGISNPVFSIMTRQPEDWETGYANYYIHSGSTMSEEDFSNVSANTRTAYKPLERQPEDWATNWGVYFESYNDGTQTIYKDAEGVSYNKYVLMTSKPTDWNTNYGNYYKVGAVYKKNTDRYSKTPTWKAKTYYKYNSSTGTYSLISKKPSNWNKTGWRNAYTRNGTGYVRITDRKAPTWAKNKYYIQQQNQKAPTWVNGKYYYKFTEITSAPEWREKYYWSKLDLLTAPVWTGGMYYEKVIDHYAPMVAEGIEMLKGYSPSQTATMIIEDYEVRIGDTVGCVDTRSGIAINEEVTNIIYKVDGGEESYDYTIGGI